MSGESEAADEDSTEKGDEPEGLCMILADTKMRNQDREISSDPSSATCNVDSDDANGGEELEIIAASRKPFRQLSRNSNKRMNLEPESDGQIFSRIVDVKLQDDIHYPGRNDRTIYGTERAFEGKV